MRLLMMFLAGILVGVAITAHSSENIDPNCPTLQELLSIQSMENS